MFIELERLTIDDTDWEFGLMETTTGFWVCARVYHERDPLRQPQRIESADFYWTEYRGWQDKSIGNDAKWKRQTETEAIEAINTGKLIEHFRVYLKELRESNE